MSSQYTLPILLYNGYDTAYCIENRFPIQKLSELQICITKNEHKRLASGKYSARVENSEVNGKLNGHLYTVARFLGGENNGGQVASGEPVCGEKVRW